MCEFRDYRYNTATMKEPTVRRITLRPTYESLMTDIDDLYVLLDPVSVYLVVHSELMCEHAVHAGVPIRCWAQNFSPHKQDYMWNSSSWYLLGLVVVK